MSWWQYQHDITVRAIRTQEFCDPRLEMVLFIRSLVLLQAAVTYQGAIDYEAAFLDPTEQASGQQKSISSPWSND